MARKLVEIDIPAFRRALKQAGCESLEDASIMLGKNRTYLNNMLRRGQCTMPILDNVATSFGCHVSELVVGTLYDEEEEWPDDLD